MRKIDVLYALAIMTLVAVADAGMLAPFMAAVNRTIPFADGIGHFVLMGTLARIAGRRWSRGGLAVGRFALPLGAIVVAAVVLIEECTQSFFPARVFSLSDLAFDLAGIVCLGGRMRRTAAALTVECEGV